jgi:predicted transcriptional regulator
MNLARLHPTLWRTCRVLANHLRLKLFALIIEQPGLTVSDAAREAKMRRPLASQYLRALESRGFLEARRRGRRVSYWPRRIQGREANRQLAVALSVQFRRERRSPELVFKLATAFAHPGRIEVFRRLNKNAMTLGELKTATGIPGRTLLRHLDKLQRRGFVRHASRRRRVYSTRHPGDGFGRALADAAVEE